MTENRPTTLGEVKTEIEDMLGHLDNPELTTNLIINKFQQSALNRIEDAKKEMKQLREDADALSEQGSICAEREDDSSVKAHAYFAEAEEKETRATELEGEIKGLQRFVGLKE